ncbi:MAG: DUF420 domain-containing protein [Chloroflexi bacterium]|nr:DUF420 domain-containing protein [Chloroflexota bacterium]
MPVWLPILNTSLIMVSGVFLAVGYRFIRHRHVAAHHRCMLTASTFAALFLVVYVARAALFGSKPFEGPHLAYVAYLAILVPHVIAAVGLGPLAFFTLRRALRADFAAHRRIAHVALPLWAFVAISGWVVYAMLYLIRWE